MEMRENSQPQAARASRILGYNVQIVSPIDTRLSGKINPNRSPVPVPATADVPVCPAQGSKLTAYYGGDAI